MGTRAEPQLANLPLGGAAYVETANRIVGRVREHQRPFTAAEDLSRRRDVCRDVPPDQRGRCCHAQNLPDGSWQQIRLGAQIVLLTGVVEQRHSSCHGGCRRLRSSDEQQTGQTPSLTQRNASLAAPSQQRVLVRRLVRLRHLGGEVFEDLPGFRDGVCGYDGRAKGSARKGCQALSVREDAAK